MTFKLLGCLAAPGCAGLPAGRRTRASALVRALARRLAKIEPKMATPIEPPIDRKKVTPDVAAPGSA